MYEFGRPLIDHQIIELRGVKENILDSYGEFDQRLCDAGKELGETMFCSGKHQFSPQGLTIVHGFEKKGQSVSHTWPEYNYAHLSVLMFGSNNLEFLPLVLRAKFDLDRNTANDYRPALDHRITELWQITNPQLVGPENMGKTTKDVVRSLGLIGVAGPLVIEAKDQTSASMILAASHISMRFIPRFEYLHVEAITCEGVELGQLHKTVTEILPGARVNTNQAVRYLKPDYDGFPSVLAVKVAYPKII